MKTLRILIGAGFVACAFPAIAQEPAAGWYAGLGVGSAKTGDDFVRNRENSIQEAFNFRTSFDDKDTAWKAFGGYRFGPYLALEASYFDLGAISTQTAFDLIGSLGGTVSTSRDVKGFALDLVAIAPLSERFSLFGRVGAYRAQSEATIGISGDAIFSDGEGGNTRNKTSHNSNWKAGVGLDWNVARNVALRIEYERYFEVGNAFAIGTRNGTGEADIDVVTLGAVYRF